MIFWRENYLMISFKEFELESQIWYCLAWWPWTVLFVSYTSITSSVLWNEGDSFCFAFLTGITKFLFRKSLLSTYYMQGSLLGLVKQRKSIVRLWRRIFIQKHYKTTWYLLFISSNNYRKTKNRTNSLGKSGRLHKGGSIQAIILKDLVE